MTFEKRAEKNSLMRNNDGSIFSKTLLTICVILTLLGGALYVFAADADADGYDDTTPTANAPKDCDDASATIRPVNNLSATFIGSSIKVCPYKYYNASLIVNASSNSSLWIDCSGTTGAFANFSNILPANRTAWLLINNTVGGVGVVNCSVLGIFKNHTGLGDPTSDIAGGGQFATALYGINISNSSNINISATQFREVRSGGLVIAGHRGTGNGTAENITLNGVGFENATNNFTGANPVVLLTLGKNIIINGSNFSAGRGSALGSGNASEGSAILSYVNNVRFYANLFTFNSLQANIKSNGSNLEIKNNSFGNATTSVWLYNSTNHTIIDNNISNAGFTTNTSNGLLYLAGVNSTTVQHNVIGNATYIDVDNAGWCIHIDQGGRNTITDNHIANCTGDVLMNLTINSRILNNNMTYARNWLLLANNSYNLSLQNNSWTNSTAVGLEFINGSNVTINGDHVYNASMKGIIFNTSRDVIFHNVSVTTFNASAADYAFDRSVNITLNGINSSRAGGRGVAILNTSAVNISNFRIINASDAGILIWNSTNVTSDYDNVTLSTINGSGHVGINVSTNSSDVNLSTILIAGDPVNFTPQYGVFVNTSTNIAFHNLTVRNVTGVGVTYGNVTGAKSVIGYCSINASLAMLNIVSAGTGTSGGLSLFNCTPTANVNMTNVLLKVLAATGSGIAFNIGVNITGTLDSYVNVTPDLVYANQTMLTGGNAALSANITMNGFGYEADGVLVDYEDDGSFHSCGVNCTATATGLSLSFNVSHFTSYQASRRVTSGTTSGGGGTGGGRGGGYKTIVPTAVGVTVQLTNYDMGRVQYGTGAYQFVMKRAGKEEVDLRVAQQDYKLSVGKALGVDLDKDGATDITVSLVAVTHNLATFVVKLGAPASVVAPAPVPVATAVPSEPSAPRVEPTGAAVDETAPAAPGEEAGLAAEAPYAAPKKKLGASTVMAVIVAVIVVLLLVMHFRKKKQTF